MNKTVLKNTIGVSCIALAAGFLLICGQIVLANSAGTDLTQEITGGVHTLEIHDGFGDVVPAPSVVFDPVVTMVDDQNTNGVLGTATQRIYMANGTETPIWNMTLNVASPGTSVWSDGGTNTYDYLNALEVNPTLGNVDAAIPGCNTTELTLSSGATFTDASPVGLVSASGTADVLCAWNIIGIGMVQNIPGQTPVGEYELPMVLSVN